MVGSPDSFPHESSETCEMQANPRFLGSDIQVPQGLHGHVLLLNPVQHEDGKGGIKLERLDIKMS